MRNSDSTSNFVWVVLLTISIVMFLGWMGIGIVADINFDRLCGGNLKRAADANTVELAVQELKVAINYIEREKLTEGYTSILWKTPDADVGFWYKNLKSSLSELEKMSPEATSLEKSNMLMKLRETLLDKGDQGHENITCPEGISIFPYNVPMAMFGWISLCLLVLFICVVFLM